MDPTFSTEISTVSLQAGGSSHEDRSPAHDDEGYGPCLEDRAPTNEEEIVSGEIEAAASLEAGDPSAAESTQGRVGRVSRVERIGLTPLAPGDFEELAAPLEDGDSPDEENEDGVSSAEENEDGDSYAEESTEEASLVGSMRETLNALPQWPNQSIGPTIFRVPFYLRKNREYLIEPSVVSIGPYHHGHKHLAPMEHTKWLLLKEILSGHNNSVTLAACVEKINNLQLYARNCYSEQVNMDDDRFVKMLILDATFIIQYYMKPADWFMREIGWSRNSVRTDLIMLENQVPFLIVETLFGLYYPGLQRYYNFLELLGKRLCPREIKSENIALTQKKFHHLLHLCHLIAVPNMSTHVTVLAGCSCFDLCKCMSSNNKIPNILPCATELQNAGIKFRKKQPPCKMMDVTFQGGILEIPLIKIYDETKTTIVNLLAFEQNQVYSVPRHLTSYIHFMDSIINAEHDVAILQRHSIIENYLSSEEEVALFFNQLCIGAFSSNVDYLSDLIKEVNRYYDSKCHRYRAKLMRDYFNSPWSLISFVAAVVVLGLTFAQTYFAGDAYFHPSP